MYIRTLYSITMVVGLLQLQTRLGDYEREGVILRSRWSYLFRGEDSWVS